MTYSGRIILFACIFGVSITYGCDIIACTKDNICLIAFNTYTGCGFLD
jgi:hypothetical protein